MLGSMYSDPCVCILILTSLCVIHMSELPSIRVDNPGNITLGGLFSLFENNHEGVCEGRIVLNGLRSLLAMQFAVDRINSNDTILPNITIGITAFDSCLNGITALKYTLEHFVLKEYAGKLSKYPIVGLVGPPKSEEAVYTAKVLDVFEIPVISYSATSEKLSDKKQFKYFSRTVPSDVSQAKAIVDFFRYFNWTYVNAVYSDDWYGTYGMKLLRKEAKKHGMVLQS
ncbi:metabotropic glutamate receptor-like [Dendronephthya gigantea]|uniref:metabotropic glutamate receptor-like n=1 Tax=Dendronephthya gigantea TaxID=151771 RepID=UPI00106A5AB6|nr:metabotropic glutamate receptor-like [Dendronephthya gigantea]